MMNAKYSDDALLDLDDIRSYICNDLKSPAAAKRTIGAILDKVKQIASFPNSGTTLELAEYRYTAANNYLIFYHVEEKEVFVDRIIHAKRDWLSILFK